MSQHSILQSHRLPSPIQVQKTKSFSPDGSAQAKKIGNYILSATLGSGTFSKVKLGYHTITKQKVAVKILDKTKIKDENDVEIMCREIHILKILRHPNIIQLYEILNIDRYIYIVMEYVEGKDLFEYIYSQNYLSEIKASYFFRQLISALEYIHTYGIVHRDIKPENILLNKTKSNIKLVDFGLSNAYMHGNLLTTACGSPCYASPEMVSGKAYDGFYSDLWSCGVVLYCMLSGKLPFDDEDIQVLYKKIKNANYILPDYLSPVAKDFMVKVFQTNPMKRIKLEEIKEHPFFNLGINGGKAMLTKGLFINIDTLPIDKELVSEIKEKYFKDKECVSEEVIKANIAENKQNTITTTYYLMLKLKESEKNNMNFKLHSKRPNTSKSKANCIGYNNLKSPHNNTTNKKEKVKILKNIIITTSNSKAFDNNNNYNYGKKLKKISFDSVSNYNSGNTFSEINSPKNDSVISVNTNYNIKKPKTKKIVELFQHNNNNNMNIMNSNNNTISSNNKINFIFNNNNCLPEHQRSPKITINLSNQHKFNTSNSFTNNIITTKIDLNEVLFHSNKHHYKNKIASRNITLPLSQGRKNKTISASKTNNLFFSMTSFKKGIFDTSDTPFERKITKNKEIKSHMKYFINSPLINSNDTIAVNLNKRKIYQPKSTIITNENSNSNTLTKNSTVNNLILPKTMSSNKSRQSSVGNKRNKKHNNNTNYNNRAFTKKIFEDDTSFISKTTKYRRNCNYSSNNNNNIGLIDPNTIQLDNMNKGKQCLNGESGVHSGMCTEYPTSSGSRNVFNDNNNNNNNCSNNCNNKKNSLNNKTLKGSNSADHTTSLGNKMNTIQNKYKGSNNVNCKIPKRNNRISNITVNINNKTDIPNNTFHKLSKNRKSLSLEHSQSQKKTNSHNKTNTNNNNNNNDIIIISSNQTDKKCSGNKNPQIKIVGNNLFNSKGKKYKNKEIDYNSVNFGKVVRKTFDKEKNNNNNSKYNESNNKRIISGNIRQLSSVSAGSSKGKNNNNNNSHNKTIHNSKRKLSLEKTIHQLKKNM